MTVLAFRPRLLRLLLPLLVLAFTAVSGNALAGPKPASGQFLTTATLIGAETLQDATLHQAVWKIAPKPAAECCVAAEGATSAEEVIAPGGKLIGTPNPGSPGDVQNLPGGDQAAQDLFNQLSEFGTPGSKPGYPGPTVDLPNGGFAGYRSAASSSSGVPAVDVNIPDTYVGKFHFP